MLSLNRKTDYALIALAHLAERTDQLASAREIGQAHGLPVPLLMNILKALQGGGIVRSARGVRGGYQLRAELDALSLHDLTVLLEPSERSMAADGADAECCGRYKIDSPDGPVRAFHSKLTRFLRDVKVADLLPTRRMDLPAAVPSGAAETTELQTRTQLQTQN